MKPGGLERETRQSIPAGFNRLRLRLRIPHAEPAGVEFTDGGQPGVRMRAE